jgi:PAS domain S-box-containing protein
LRDRVLDAAPDAVITIDESGAIMEWNATAELMFGFARHAALGRKVGDLIVPEPHRPAHEAGLRRVVAGGESRIIGRRVRMSAQHSDGREIMVELFVTRTSEAPLRFTAWLRELSEHDAATMAAGETHALLEAGEKLAAVGSWEWTPSQSKLLWSDNVYRILGLRPGERSPDPKIIRELTHPDDRDRVRSSQSGMAASGELSSPVSYRIIRPDGDVRHLRTALAVAEVRDGQPYRFVGYVEDLTERIRARRAIAAHLAVDDATTAWASFEQGAQALLAGLAAALDCQGGIVWLPRGNQLVARMVWRGRTADATLLDSVQRGSRLPRGSHLAWSAQRLGEAVRAASVIVIPAVFKGKALALVELRSHEHLELTEPLMRYLTGIGYELGQFLDARSDELDIPLLTKRELEVLALAARGLSGRQIAERLVISPATVKTHLANLYPKLGASDRAAAVATALRLGVID